MKKILTVLLAAGMLLGAASGASAIDFKAKGQWLMGFGVGDKNLMSHYRNRAGEKIKKNTSDTFNATQRIRLQLEAVASESLSGTVQFQIGNQPWGKADKGAALGADGANQIGVRQAYIDWMVPQTDLKVRMGLHEVILPNKAGGTAVMDAPVAGVVASYQFNENLGLTALWMRPFNDNYSQETQNSDGTPHVWGSDPDNYLDNMDLFGLMVPVTLDGFEITPWAMYGMKGKNTDKFNAYKNGFADGNPYYTLAPYAGLNGYPGNLGGTGKAYGSMFWAGLPFAITAWDPLNIEVDINYGYVESMGRYIAWKGGYNDVPMASKRSSTERQGWLAKALVEYKMDWGVPGIFGWYGSGDDGNPKNGSERMPSIAPYGNFTSFLGDSGPYSWGGAGGNDMGALSYAGTWGIGLQIRDMSFVEDLKHTFRVAYWGGTNSTSAVKYMATSYAWDDGRGNYDGPYLTTNDGLLEFNLVNEYKMYENFNVYLDLGYVANFMDNDTWKKAGQRNTSFEKQDMWKAQLVFGYSF